MSIYIYVYRSFTWFAYMALVSRDVNLSEHSYPGIYIYIYIYIHMRHVYIIYQEVIRTMYVYIYVIILKVMLIDQCIEYMYVCMYVCMYSAEASS